MKTKNFGDATEENVDFELGGEVWDDQVRLAEFIKREVFGFETWTCYETKLEPADEEKSSLHQIKIISKPW